MYYIGIDGGGTKTTGVLADIDGKVLRTRKSGAGNISVLDKKNFSRLLTEMILELLENESEETVKWATLAFAGAGRVEEKNVIKNVISNIGINNFNILSDAELTYYSTHRDRTGVLISAGTGSICIYQDNQGKLHQLGGWGYLLGDEGSGYDIGRNAIRYTLKEAEIDRKVSTLSGKILNHFGVQKPKELITKIYQNENAQNYVASCAKIVCDEASNGDLEGEKIVQRAAESLFQLCLKAIKCLDSKPPYHVALTGGILQEGSPILRIFKKLAANQQMDFHYISQDILPAAAGVLRSVRSAGAPVNDALVEKLRKIVF